LEKKLPIEDAPKCNFVDLLDEKKYFVVSGESSKRHRVKNNLLGGKDLCPVIKRTEKLEQWVSEDYGARVESIIGQSHKRLISRAASFLLRADTKATFEIEGERAPQSRLERWGKVIMEAGKYPLSIEEYRDVLISHSAPLMDLIDWKANDLGNVEVENETLDLYRYLNITNECEFLFKSVIETMEVALPRELLHLKNFDIASGEISEFIEMPDNSLSLLINLILGNDGSLSKRKKEKRSFTQSLVHRNYKKLKGLSRKFSTCSAMHFPLPHCYV
jgi:hypothetical protein